VISEVAVPGAARAAPGDTPIGYQLKSHVRACIDGDSVVFLDLRRDRYWSAALDAAPRISGLTHKAGVSNVKTARLIALDLIEANEGAAATFDARPRAPEVKIDFSRNVRTSLSEQAWFWLACASASHALRTRRLDLTLASLDARKRRLRAARVAAHDAVGAFEALRPWYPHKRVCLFDALALAHFLVSQGVSPDLVFGVRTAPFAAHCWIEIDGALAGDASDHCASFTPIAWV